MIPSFLTDCAEIVVIALFLATVVVWAAIGNSVFMGV